jgi:NAD(P)-dependent dehydrogenase (short-subunit alcohol dehydrogenase family)
MTRTPRLVGCRALVTGGTSGIGRAIASRFVAEGAHVVIAARTAADTKRVADTLGTGAVVMDVSDERSVVAGVAHAVEALGGLDLAVNNAGLGLNRPLLETTASDWDAQHDVMARGAFLVSRESARTMIDQGTGGDLVYIVSKNSIFTGPNNIAYSAAKADQAHQVRLLAAELGPYGIRVNGVNPGAVVQGSRIFAGEWGASRAAVYGVPESELGAHYAKSSLLGREVLPEHVASAVMALVGGDLPLTTGIHLPVDAGIAAAFPR